MPKTKTTKSTLTSSQKTRIINWVNKGKGSDFIADKVGVKKMQVAAVRAHVTMNTYA